MKSIYVTVRIDYDFDEAKAEGLDTSLIAVDLAINPNYDTVADGVQVDSVEICDINLNEE